MLNLFSETQHVVITFGLAKAHFRHSFHKYETMQAFFKIGAYLCTKKFTIVGLITENKGRQPECSIMAEELKAHGVSMEYDIAVVWGTFLMT